MTETKIDNAELVTLVDDLFADVSVVTPYQLIKVVNGLLDRNLPTQMAYNYVKKGFIAAHKNEVGKLVIDREVAVQWIAAYVNKNA